MDSSNVYYNVSLSYPQVTPYAYQQPLPIRYTKTISQPIINKCSDFELAITRFKVPLRGTPIFIFKDNQYTITLSYMGDNYTQYLTWIPNNNLANNYIWVYQNFIDSINLAFKNLYTLLVAAHVGAMLAPPFMKMDSETLLLSLFMDTTAVTNGVQVFVNQSLYNFFPNFKDLFNSGVQPFNKEHQLIVEPLPTSTQIQNVVVVTAISYYQITQPQATTFLWNDVQALVFITNLMPINKENVPVLGNAQPSGGVASSSANQLSIVTDFELNQSDINISNHSSAQFFPQGPLRWIDLLTDNPLYTIDIQVYFRTLSQELFPVILLPSDDFTMKLLFRKKNNIFNYT